MIKSFRDKIRRKVFPSLYRSWKTQDSGPREPGYTLLLTVPPDLPVFSKLAVDVCARQDHRHLVETLVIPDRNHRPFRDVFESLRSAWPEGKLRLIEPRWRDRWVRSWNTTASVIHWMQLINGVAACRSTHALLHDVDLFLLDANFFENHYRRCAEAQRVCAGMDRPWSGSEWFAEPRFRHLVGTWELMFDVEWMRSFSPAQIRPHTAAFPEGSWWFETTLYAQACTDPARVVCYDRPPDHVHFQFVIGTYRAFQESQRPFADERFCLLLIRLLIDAFDPDSGDYDLPRLEEFVDGLSKSSGPITYLIPRARQEYVGFRRNLERLLQSPQIGAAQADRIRDGLQRFDEVFEVVSDEPLEQVQTG